MRHGPRATGATALVKLGAPGPEELGFAKWLGVEEIGGTNVVTLRQGGAAGAVATVVLRASTEQLLEDLERAVDDGVNTYKVCAYSCAYLCKKVLAALPCAAAVLP